MTQTLADLQTVWQETRADLMSQAATLLSEDPIHTQAQFATAAWRNRIRVWCSDLDEMILQYPESRSLEEVNVTIRKASVPSAFEQGQLAFREASGEELVNPFEEGTPERNNFDVGKRYAAAHAAPHQRHVLRMHSGEED